MASPTSLGCHPNDHGALVMVYACWSEGARATEDALVQLLHRKFDAGVATLNIQQSLFGNEINEAVAKAQAYLNNVIDKIKNAADWQTLNKLAQPLLSPVSLPAGVLYGVVESLVGDVASLLSLGKMLVLAGIYERIKNFSGTLIMDPTSLALAITVRSVPGLWAEAKKCDEAFWGLLHELMQIAEHPINFIEIVGKKIWNGVADDWNKLRGYSQEATVLGDFQAGRIIGHALYQVAMMVLLVLSVAGIVVKLAARFPWIARLARFLKGGGEIAELGESAEGAKTAESLAEGADAADQGSVAKTTKPQKQAAPESDTPTAPAPRTEVRNGYTYALDDKGRVTNVTGDLTSNPTQGRNPAAQLQAGGPDRLPTDEGGHYIGRRFDGPTDDFNHFAQDMNFNRGEYKKLENVWQRALDNGSDVNVDINPNYVGDSLRPDSIDVTYTIDGVPYQKTFLNQPGGGL